MNTAYFVKYPRTLADLQKPHLLDNERPYEIVADVALAAIDYENFITDMVAGRKLIEDNAELCSGGKILKCIFVHRCGRADGILVMPKNRMFVGRAALICND